MNVKIIHQPKLYWPRLALLIEQIAKARKTKQRTSELEAEARMIRTAIMAYELRHVKDLDDCTFAYGDNNAV